MPPEEMAMTSDVEQRIMEEQKNASNIAALALVEQEKQNLELTFEIQDLKKEIIVMKEKCEEYEQELQQTREVELANLQTHINDLDMQKKYAEGKESEAYEIIEFKKIELKEKQD